MKKYKNYSLPAFIDADDKTSQRYERKGTLIWIQTPVNNTKFPKKKSPKQ